MTASAARTITDVAARVGPQPVAGGTDEQEEHQRDGAPDRGDRRQVDEVGDDEHDAAVITSPAWRAEAGPAPKKAGNSPTFASIAVRLPEA